MKTSDKNLLLDKLSVCYNRVNYLKTICEERGKTDEAAQFERRKARLKIEIDGLLRDLYHDWMGSAQALADKLDAANESVEKAIKDIERKIDTAKNITRAIGYIDDAIKIAADLVA